MARRPVDPCYCVRAPRDRASGQLAFRCNWCWNSLADDKNTLVRENCQLRADLAEAQRALLEHEEAEG